MRIIKATVLLAAIGGLAACEFEDLGNRGVRADMCPNGCGLDFAVKIDDLDKPVKDEKASGTKGEG